MSGCCNDNAEALALLRARQGRVLYLVLGINATMFVVEFSAGWLAQSMALLGDSLDMLGDAAVYAVTLFALTASDRTRAGVALLKGLAMAVLGLIVLLEAGRKVMVGSSPDPAAMVSVGALALLANAWCFILLSRHRADDLNMRSVWLCSRNDLIGNVSVLLAAAAVHGSGAAWPDVVIGLATAALFLHSARRVLSEAWSAWRSTTPYRSPRNREAR